MRIKKQNWALFLPLIFFLSVSAVQGQSQMHFDCKSAEAMMKAILALHQQADASTVEKLSDEALKLEAYQVSQERYTNPKRSKEDQVTLLEFRRFILSFSGDRVDTQNNRRLVITKPFYNYAIKNPEKFQKALQKIHSVASSRFQDSFERALSWLPTTTNLEIYVWVLFDIGGSGAWAFRTKDGKQNIGFNILHMLDDQGEFDIELFAGTLAHEIHHLGLPLSSYFKSINYDSLDKTSRLKLYSDYFKTMITEGMAIKFCNNAPGVLSPKPNPERDFAASRLNLKEWAYFQEQLADIHSHAVKDLRKILTSTEIDGKEFESDYDKYWTWKAGIKEGKIFTLGREYYYGAELLGVINVVFGRESLFEGLFDLRKIPILYNEGVKKLRPKNLEQYLFPEDIIKMVQEL
jgi:5-bromo-4-chloroindolyl phosphate hydrolysis protein